MKKLSLIAVTTFTLGLACFLKPSFGLKSAYGSVVGSNIYGKKIFLSFNLIWEGKDLNEINLKSLENFREQYDSIKFHHFIDPAYFLKFDDAPKKISRIIKPGDYVGLYLNPWRSTVIGSKSTFRASPSSWGNSSFKRNCEQDCGDDVPLAIYPKEELTKIISFSKNLFKDHGIVEPKSFMAGSWYLTPKMIETLANNGFEYDFSAISKETVKDKLEHFPIYSWIETSWPVTEPTTQPYRITSGNGSLYEVGTSAGVLDYQNITQLKAVLNDFAIKANDTYAPLVYSISFFQESIDRHMGRLKALVHYFPEFSEKNKIQLANLEFESMKPFKLPEIESNIANALPSGVPAPPNYSEATATNDNFDAPIPSTDEIALPPAPSTYPEAVVPPLAH